jgi:hypothetical protein
VQQHRDLEWMQDEWRGISLACLSGVALTRIGDRCPRDRQVVIERRVQLAHACTILTPAAVAEVTHR